MIEVERDPLSLEIPIISIEPKIVFQLANGSGEVTTQIETLQGIKDKIRQAIAAIRPLTTALGSLHKEKSKVQNRGRTHSGKPYNTTERRQILQQIGVQEASAIAKLRRITPENQRIIERAGWLVRSSPKNPLTVRFEDNQGGKLVFGEPLNEDETRWQVFLADKVEPKFSNHPKISLAKNYFIARHILGRQEEVSSERKEQAEKFLAYLQINVDDISEDLVPLIRKITDFDFSQPLLPELETLKKLNS